MISLLFALFKKVFLWPRYRHLPTHGALTARRSQPIAIDVMATNHSNSI
jgi:hypothetical protein